MLVLTAFNFDLIVVGSVIAGMCVLGLTAFMSDMKSATTRAFMLFTLAGALWSGMNYAFYHTPDASIAFSIIRGVIFVAIWFVLFLFQFLYAFPQRAVAYPRWYRLLVVPFSAVVAVLTLTPFVFERVVAIGTDGTIDGIQNGPGIFVFVAWVTFLIFGGLLMFIRKMQRTPKEAQAPYRPVLWGIFLTFILIITFNLILPAFFNAAEFIPLGALFIFPTVVGAAYAIRTHHLFNVKVFTTAMLIFFLSATTLFETMAATASWEILLQGSVFLLTLVIGVMLISSVIREVEQREKIEALAKELEQTNEQQTVLMHFVTHEVKGFLAKDEGAFASLLDGDFGALTPELRPFVERALAETRTGVESVLNILKASNQKKGTTEYKKESFDLAALTADAVQKARLHAEQKGLSLALTADPAGAPYTIVGDKAELGDHVLRNLIENAIAYTPSGHISVSLAKKQGRIALTVTDTGVGITDEDKKRLFTEGGHGKDSQSINVHSTGYGLFIAKNIIMAHNGTIRAESAGQGKGSTFVVELPA